MSTKKEFAGGLYVSGLPFPAIAEATGCSRRTLRRWRAEADGREDDWDALRKAGGPDTWEQAIVLIKKRLLEVLSDARFEATGAADAAYKLGKLLETVKDKRLDTKRRLQFLQDLTDFSWQQNFPDATREGSFAVVRAYLGYIKEQLRGEGSAA